jgi:hypothetical protein
MDFVYQDEKLVERAPNLFAPLFVKQTDQGATFDDVLAALRRGESVTIRPLTPVEAAWAEEAVVIYEMGTELAMRREMLYMGLIQCAEGVNPDVVVDRFRTAGIEPVDLAHALAENLPSIQGGTNGTA